MRNYTKILRIYGIIDDENRPVTNQPVLYIKEMNRAAFSDLGLLL